MDFKTIKGMRLSDQVVSELLEMVREGKLSPGDKLPNETELAENFGVSRGILREALTSLQSQGYIRRKPKDGTYLEDNVRDMIMSQSINSTLKNAAYTDLLDFREGLEEKIVEKAIERASDEALKELLETLNIPSYLIETHSAGYYFHRKLAEISNNTFYVNFIDTYYGLMDGMANKDQKDEERNQQVKAEHREIAVAVCRRDKKAAVEAVRHHFAMADKAHHK